MALYEVQAQAVDSQNEIVIDVDLLRDGEKITTIRTRHNLVSANKDIIDSIRATVLKHARAVEGIHTQNRIEELAEGISGRTFEL